MRPSVTSATLWPRAMTEPSTGVNLCSSGMPIALGPWKRTTATKSRIEFARAVSRLEIFLRVKNPGRGADLPMLRRDRADLNHGAAEIAVEHFQAAITRKRLCRRAQNRFIEAHGGRWPESEFTVVEIRLLRIIFEIMPGNGFAHRDAQSPACSKDAMRKPVPPAAVKWFTSAVPFG